MITSNIVKMSVYMSNVKILPFLEVPPSSIKSILALNFSNLPQIKSLTVSIRELVNGSDAADIAATNVP